jgi:hypothetical protein
MRRRLLLLVFVVLSSGGGRSCGNHRTRELASGHLQRTGRG